MEGCIRCLRFQQSNEFSGRGLDVSQRRCWCTLHVCLSTCPRLVLSPRYIIINLLRLFSDAATRGGRTRPEARFLTSLVTVWLFPISLFWFAFTSDGRISWVSPLVAGGVLGFCNPILWIAMLNYITDSYPSVAASAIAAFSLPSFTIAAAFVHAGIAMFESMSTTWAVFSNLN